MYVALFVATATSNTAGGHGNPETATITYVGVIRDQPNFQRLRIGKAGYWFPQFNAKKLVTARPTGENARDALPAWVAPLNHVTSILDPAFKTRTFSQDGPARSMGGKSAWNEFTLPSGEKGRSGAIVDPFARKNTNNTINRIQLRDQVPARFFFHVVTDNTNREYDPTVRLRARGHCRGVDFEADTAPAAKELTFNGIADIYTFRCDAFQAGDFLKLRLSGDSGGGPSLGGFMFDTKLDAQLDFNTPRDDESQANGSPKP